jgi:GNAT superfamily N-acetyltransferase
MLLARMGERMKTSPGPGTGIVVRAIARADRERWEGLWRGYNRFYERRIPGTTTDMTWSRFFDARERVHALVAERDGDIVGIVHYLFHRSTSLVGPTCYLQDLFTAPEARGAGVGRALIEAVYDRARKEGAQRVYWHTHETNATAIRLYEKVAERSGFIVYRKELPRKR